MSRSSPIIISFLALIISIISTDLTQAQIRELSSQVVYVQAGTNLKGESNAEVIVWGFTVMWRESVSPFPGSIDDVLVKDKQTLGQFTIPNVGDIVGADAAVGPNGEIVIGLLAADGELIIESYNILGDPIPGAFRKETNLNIDNPTALGLYFDKLRHRGCDQKDMMCTQEEWIQGLNQYNEFVVGAIGESRTNHPGDVVLHLTSFSPVDLMDPKNPDNLGKIQLEQPQTRLTGAGAGLDITVLHSSVCPEYWVASLFTDLNNNKIVAEYLSRDGNDGNLRPAMSHEENPINDQCTEAPVPEGYGFDLIVRNCDPFLGPAISLVSQMDPIAEVVEFRVVEGFKPCLIDVFGEPDLRTIGWEHPAPAHMLGAGLAVGLVVETGEVGKPQNFRTDALDGSVVLDWDDNPESNLKDYRVYRSLDFGGPFTMIAEPTESTYTDTDVVNLTTYFYNVRAVSLINDESEASPTKWATPLPPQGATYNATKATITVDGDLSDWTDLPSDTLSQFLVNHTETIDKDRAHDIRFAWDDDNLYISVEETTVDPNPVAGADANDWLTRLHPWGSDSVGFYDAPTIAGGPMGPGPGGSTGPYTQFWVGMTTDSEPDRHMARTIPENTGTEFLIIGQNAVSVTGDGRRICEFHMPWVDIKFSTLEGGPEIVEGLSFRLDPLITDVVSDKGCVGNCQSFLGGEIGVDFVEVEDMSFVLLGPPPPPEGAIYIRGDANADTNVNLPDMQSILNFLFLGASDPKCMDAADLNDDGNVNLPDAQYGLNFLFLGGPQPKAPFPDCDLGPDPGSEDCADDRACSEG